MFHNKFDGRKEKARYIILVTLEESDMGESRLSFKNQNYI